MADRAPVLLLPPSESKAPGGRGRPWRPGTAAQPALDGARAEVLAALGPVGDTVAGAPTRPAIARCTGVLYQQLGWVSLLTPARRLGGRTVLVARACGACRRPATRSRTTG